MRDRKRILPTLDVLFNVWKSRPDWRLGQLIGNADINYHTEDDIASKRLESLLADILEQNDEAQRAAAKCL